MSHSDSLSTATNCRYADCEAPATTAVSFPASLHRLGSHTYPYCEKHADEITGDSLVFPGARRVDLEGSEC